MKTKRECANTEDPCDAARGAPCIALGTEWPEYLDPTSAG